MLLRRTVKAKRTESLLTALRMTGLVVKMYANLSWKAMISDQKKIPITKEVTTETLVANLAAFPLPAPSSFDTRTLRCYNKSIGYT